MRNLLLFMLLVAIFVIGRRSWSCHDVSFGPGISGEGPVQTETRNPGVFTGVQLDLPGSVEISIGDTHHLELSAQQNLIAVIQTEVKDGTLRLFSKENIRDAGDLRIRITMPGIQSLTLAGSGDIKVQDTLKTDLLTLNVAGSGNMHCGKIVANKLVSSVSGSGDLALGGMANEMVADISGSGGVDAGNFSIKYLKVGISGSGELNAHVDSLLNASVSGSGEVLYSGHPEVQSSVSGSGKVEPVQAR